MFFFSSRRRHTRWPRDWSSDVCSSDLSNLPYCSLVAPVNDPFSCPNSWLSTRLSGTAGRFTATNGPLRRSECSWKIGRASCRERVEVSVGAGSVKEKREGKRPVVRDEQ